MVETFKKMEDLIIPTKKGKNVRVGSFRMLDGYYDLTKFGKHVAFNRHNFNRRFIVKECRKIQENGLALEFDNSEIYVVEAGQGGVTKVHPILMLTVLKETSVDLYFQLEAILLNGLRDK